MMGYGSHRHPSRSPHAYHDEWCGTALWFGHPGERLFGVNVW